MSERTDTALVESALAGETDAFCTLVRRYQDHVYGVALGILAEFHAALDAAQEAFLCAYCDLRKLRDPARFGAWLCGIARNTAFEVRRDRHRQASLARKAADVTAPETAPSTHQLAEENETRAQVQQALRRVGEKDREALTLCYADGLSYAQISDFLNISVGTLKGRLQRGRAALRKELVMVDRVCKQNAPDEAFARSLERAIRVFSAKGPATHHIPSEWHDALHEETLRVLAGGEEGFRVALALSHAGTARLRHSGTVLFGLMRDERSLRELERMLEDRSARVRRSAVRWYPARLRRGVASGPVLVNPDLNRPAPIAPADLDRLLERLRDENFNVRLYAVHALGTCRDTDTPRAPEALRAALDDPKHKVRHAAARILNVPCPGCGRTWCVR